MATLVTGAFGCIGAWVCKRLLEAGEKPVAFDVGDDPWRMRMILGPERLRDVVMVKGDIADREGVTRVVGEHEITRIIHLAAWQVPRYRQDPSRGALINVVGTANVFEAAKAHRDRVARVAYFSSAAVFGPPHLYRPGPVTDDSPPKPATHYGVYVEQPIPFPAELADPGYQRDLGPAPRTGLKDGIRKTLDEFAALKKAGRLDARELEPAK